MDLNKCVESNLIRIQFKTVALITVALPLFSFIFCIIWSLAFNFVESTSTHCQVFNLLPSISAAIGGFVPQKYVWRIGIGVHAAPRFLVAAMYRNYYKKLLIDEPLWSILATLTSAIQMLENSCLIGLTYISSSENYPAHEKCFITFVISALTFMILSCSLPRIAARKSLTAQEFQSLQLKSLLALINVMASLSAVFFFIKHNKFCQPGLYTMFALSEYTVVLTNMGFHLTSCWDFQDLYLTIGGSISSHQKTARLIPP